MKRTIKKFLLPVVAAVAVTFGACSDWTETESLDINYPSLDKQNPELYKQYLEALRTYKATDHPVTIVSVPGRTAAPSQQNEHFTNLPDSVDYICVTNPAGLHPMLAAEITEVHKKGTRVVYDIDYEAIESLWEKELEEEQAAKPEQPGTPGEPAVVQESGDDEPTSGQELERRFLEFCREQAELQLSYCARYGFDGVTVSYEGRAPLSMTEAERAAYAARQDAFFSTVAGWTSKHGDKLLFFRGSPQNLVDVSFLSGCRYIIVPAPGAVSADQLSLAVLMSAASGVPTDRFIVGVTTPSITDPADENGYFSAFEADGKSRMRATKGAARWTVAPAAGYTKAGIAVADAQNDYYNITLVYKNIREAIDIMNPAPKN